MATSIQISHSLQKELLKRKLYMKETYEDVIWHLLQDTRPLNASAKRLLAHGRADARMRRTISLRALTRALEL